MTSKSTKTENPSNTNAAGNNSPALSSRFGSALSDPELMQPTILAISVTYIVLTASIYLKLLEPMPAAVIFTYYCCILGIISTIVFYLRLLYKESGKTTVWTIHVLVQCILIGLYIAHWFVPVPGSEDDQKIPQRITLYKMYNPLHFVVRVIFIVSAGISLVASLID